MKRILVPTDFSGTAENALDYAVQFAKDTEAEIMIMHVFPEFSYAGLFDVVDNDFSLTAQEAERIERRLEELANTIENDHGVECKYLLKHSHTGLVNSLEKKIEKGIFDLVIIGSSGADSLSKTYLGSHSYRLARKVVPPVLVIPDSCTYEKPKQVVYATDYEEQDVSVLKTVHDLLGPFNPHIKVIHVSENDSEVSRLVYKCIVDLMEDDSAVERVSFERFTSEQDTADAIELYVLNGAYDMLVLLTKERTFVERIFHKSVTKKLSGGAVYPLLII